MANSNRPDITLRIILVEPNRHVVFGIQQGAGNNYETIQKRQYEGEDLVFECSVQVKTGDGSPDFAGPVVQGPKGGRFIYVDIGTYAGQAGSPWSRRLKVPLQGISNETIQTILNNSKLLLETTVPGKGKDGGPNCATVKPFAGWSIAEL